MFAWFVEADAQVGNEVGRIRHFYKPPVLRQLAKTSADILAREQETASMLPDMVGG